MKRLSELIIITVYLLFSALIWGGEINASSSEDYLWLEFGEQQKEKNGSSTQLLFIYYGRFPDRKGDPFRLENLKAFYTLNQKDDKSKDVCYTADIEAGASALKGGKNPKGRPRTEGSEACDEMPRDKKTDKGTALIKINSAGTNYVTVFVEGGKSSGRLGYNYLAQTSFFLYGKSVFEKKKTRTVFPGNTSRRFRIDINPGYWPQTGVLFKGALLFYNNPLGESKIDIFDENESPVNIKTDKGGSFFYVPPDDRKLRRQGITAYKQTVLAGEQIWEDTVYRSAYTLLLHRSRFGYRNLPLGISILGGTMVVAFIIVLAGRRNSQV